MPTRDAACSCGQLRLTTDGEPVRISIGAFADPAFPAPTVYVYESRRHPWVELPDSIEHEVD